MNFVKRGSENARGNFAASLLAIAVISIYPSLGTAATPNVAGEVRRAELGRVLFSDVALSRDGHTRCATCHDPAHAYADPHTRSTGVDGKIGTRNAPSLIGIGADHSFFWDGRRTRLEDVVADPFTNPVELGWPSTDALLDTLRKDPLLVKQFRDTFPQEKTSITLNQLKLALAAFIRSLTAGTSAWDRAVAEHKPLPPQAELGRHLFTDIAKCGECHTTDGSSARFSDGQYHHSGIGQSTQSVQLPQLAGTVLAENLDANELGPKVLTDESWSALGRFTVTHKPADIGAFHTPSLRNVALTAPYMHDGSIATLSEAVDHEIYYRGFSRGHPVNLSQAERRAIVAFLELLTDTGYGPTKVIQP